MLTYTYIARITSSGEKTKGQIQAENESAAARLLTQQGMAPIDIEQVEGKKGLERFRNRVGSKDKVLFSRQLSTLINAGLPLVQSLRTVSEQTQSKPLKVVINEVITDVESGITFAESLAKHPKVFNGVYVSLIEAGETSGTLDKSLERLATQQEKDAEVISKVRGAMIYPAIVLVVITFVIIFMLVTVLPQVEQLYDDLSQSLPFITAVMVATSKLLISYWYLFLVGFLIGAYLIFRYFQSESGGRVLDRFKMAVPLFGKLFMKMYMARFCRTGTTLISSGVPMLEMLRITGTAVNNVHIDEATQKAAQKVKSGTALSAALTDDPNFLALVPQMIKIGEQSGSLDKMLDKTATFYENEVDNEIKTISTTIEPALMVVLAVVAGLLVAAILLPVYGLVNQNLAL